MDKFLISVVLVACGLVIFVLGCPYYNISPANGSVLFMLIVSAAVLAGALVCRFTPKLETYWQAMFALFTAAAAMCLLNSGILNFDRTGMPPAQDIAVDKVSQALHIIPVILIANLSAGYKPQALFIAKGNLKQGLTFGVIWFVIFAIGATLLFWKFGMLPSIPKMLPWILLFVFTNALMEELWFRATFLQAYEKLIGRTAAILVTALIFGVSHVPATYDFPGGRLLYGAIVFMLGFAGGHALLKQESIIGAVLFHAGYDLLIILPVLESL